ncbi:unnamed protein product, partial [Adineta steineri]
MMDVSGNLIGDNGTQYLANVLQNNATLTQLNLEGNPGSCCSAVSAGIQVRNDKTITKMDLHGKSNDDIGMKFLTDALINNETLTTLELRNNQIKDEGAKYLADLFKINRTLATLDLRGNQIGDQGAQYFIDALKTNTNLRYLNLETNKSRFCAAITKIHESLLWKHQPHLYLDCHGIGDSVIEYISLLIPASEEIRHIRLPSNKISDTGAQYLATAIKQSTTIIDLDLRSNDIGDEGAYHLADALKYNQTLSTLKLRGNKIGPIGKQYLEDVQQIRTMGHSFFFYFLKTIFNNFIQTPIEFDLSGAIKLLCPQDHHLKLCDYEQRKRNNTHQYPVSEYGCDTCLRGCRGLSWHCSCTSRGFDICETCSN